jgi:hypothetical protein
MNSEEIKVEPLIENKDNFKQLKAFVFQNQPKSVDSSQSPPPQDLQLEQKTQSSPPKPPGLCTKAKKPISQPSFNLPYDFTNFQKKDIEAFDFTSKQKLLDYISSQP